MISAALCLLKQAIVQENVRTSFSKMLDRHWEGIVAHGYYRISSGRVEGVNNLIKTVRRQAYGYRDDDYFFLKIMDASRRKNTSERESEKAMPA